MSGILVAIALIGLIICLIGVVEYFSRRVDYDKNGNKTANVPPGQLFFGHFKYIEPANLISGLEYLRNVYGKCNDLYVFGQRFRVIADPAVAREIMSKRPKIFRRPVSFEAPFIAIGMPNNLFGAEGMIWSRSRRLASPQFSHHNTKLMLDRVVDEAKTLVESVSEYTKDSRTIQMDCLMSMYTSRVIGRVALGVEVDNKDEYFASPEIFNDIAIIMKFTLERTLYFLPDWSWKYSPKYCTEVAALKSMAVLDSHCKKHIRRIGDNLKNGNKSADDKLSFIEILLLETEKTAKSAKSGGITEAEMLENVKLLFIAGSDTTSTTLTWASYFLATRKDCLEKMREELDRVCGTKQYIQNYEQYSALNYVRVFVKETLRLMGPTSFFSAELVRGEGSKEYTCETNGMHIVGNDTIFIDFDGCLLDPEVYENPLEFNPDRWLPHGDEEVSCERLKKMEFNFIAFGSGPRICPGMELATMELIVGTAALAAHVDLQLAVPANEIKRVLNFTTRANKMPLTASDRVL